MKEVSRQKNGYDGLIQSIKFKKEDSIKEYLENGCDLDGKYTNYEYVPVCLTLKERDLDAFNQLKERGANMYQLDSNNFNAYMHFISNYSEYANDSRYELERTLSYLINKFDYKIENNEYLSFINDLLLKSDISKYKDEYKDMKSIYGLSTLYYAVIKDNSELFSKIFKDITDMNTKDNYDFSILDYYKMIETPNIDSYLETMDIKIEKSI